IINDILDETDELVNLTLSDATNVAVMTPSVTGTIIDDDPTPDLLISDQDCPEQANDPCSIAVSLSAPSGKLVTVDYNTMDGEALSMPPEHDYVPANDVLFFPPGTTVQTIQVTILDDTSHESNERFYINLSNASNAIAPNTPGTVTIIDNDPILARPAPG